MHACMHVLANSKGKAKSIHAGDKDADNVA